MLQTILSYALLYMNESFVHVYLNLDLVGPHFDVNNTFSRRLHFKTTKWQQLHAIIVWKTFATIEFICKVPQKGTKPWV